MQRRPNGLSAQDCTGQLAEMETLQPGWNGYDAPVPSLTSIFHAKSFLTALFDADLPPTSIAPSAVGGVVVSVRHESRKCFALFCNDGTAELLMVDLATDQLSGRNLATAPAAYVEAVQLIQACVSR